ncbi:hypothetical protein KJ742_07750 [Patescibacteria group bacterium]|nr:hypothetical protein [Patescibacteria group bacterium]MBU1683805.1 hypothetical protein [Patescibacteria group bacterium]
MDDLFFKIIGSITDAIQTKYENFANMAPYILGAIALFLFGWILAELVSRAIIKMSKKIRLEWLADKLGLEHFLKRIKSKFGASHIVAKGVKGYLIFLFFIEATKVAQLTRIAEFLTKVINYVPDVIVAIFIMLVGIRIGNTMQILISTSLSFAKTNTANILGIAAKGTVIAFAVLAALTELEIAEILIQTLFIGFVAMLTIAGGLAFGLGGKDVVKELLEAIKKVEIREHKKDKVVR